MKANFKIYIDGAWTEYPVDNHVVMDCRLDEQLDTGSLQMIDSESKPIPPMSVSELVISDGENTLSMPAYCFDTLEVRGEDYYVHNLTLCEPARRFMGVLIDGIKVTQPREESGALKKSLYEVTERVLKTCVLQEKGKRVFTLTTDPNILSILKNTESPEFDWEAETLLWECLKDIGNVIGCMPRLTFNEPKTDFSVLTFDEVNEPTGFYEL